MRNVNHDLAEDWHEAFNGVKGCGEEKAIWSKLKWMKVDFCEWGEAKFLSFVSYTTRNFGFCTFATKI